MIALYARQSVERENSVSIETQLEFCRRALRQEEDPNSAAVYRDEGASGGNTNRPDFQRMMTDIRQGRIHKVVTYKLDRISRSLCDFVGILQTFQQYHVKFISSQEAFDTDTIYGDLVLKILMVFAEFERASIINRVRDAYDKRTDLGIYMGGRRPYGFRLEETELHGIRTKRLAPVPEEAQQVQKIYALYGQENATLRSVLTQLEETSEHPWTAAKISAIVKNPLYVMADSRIYTYFEQWGVRMVSPLPQFDGKKGAFLYGRTTHDQALEDWSDMKLVLGQHQGLIPSGLWLRCQEKTEKNRRAGTSLSNRTSWLGGKVFCGRCGRPMTTIKSRRADGSARRYFICSGKRQGQCAGLPCTVYVDDLERLAREAVGQILKNLLPLRQKMPTAEGQENHLRLKLAEVQSRQNRLGRLLLEEDLTPELLAIANRQAAALEKQEEHLRERLEQVSSQTVEIDVGALLWKRWGSASFAERKAICGILLHSVLLHQNGDPEFIWNA